MAIFKFFKKLATRGANAAAMNDPSAINNLSSELISSILGYLGYEELMQLSRASKEWNTCISNNFYFGKDLIKPSTPVQYLHMRKHICEVAKDKTVREEKYKKISNKFQVTDVRDEMLRKYIVSNKMECLMVLVDVYKADVNEALFHTYRNKLDIFSPVYLAALCDRIKIVSFLLQRGAKIYLDRKIIVIDREATIFNDKNIKNKNIKAMLFLAKMEEVFLKPDLLDKKLTLKDLFRKAADTAPILVKEYYESVSKQKHGYQVSYTNEMLSALESFNISMQETHSEAKRTTFSLR